MRATSARTSSLTWASPRYRARYSAADQLPGVHERPRPHAPHGVPLAIGAVAETHAERLLSARNVQRPVEPVPHGELEAAIAADVLRLAAVVQLMLSRAD